MVEATAATKTAVETAQPAPTALPTGSPRRLTPTLRALFQSKMFWAVLVLKVTMGALLGSYYMRDLFVPFLNYFVESQFSNPWTHFASLGRINSFPYPPVMLYIMAIPRVLFGWLLPGGVDTVSWAHLLVMRLPLLACDITIAAVLALWFPGRVKRILGYYWCSPLTLYVCYWHGQLDIIPTALFVVALYLIGKQRFPAAMVVLGLSLAAKTHLFVALPFLFLYLLQEIGAARTIRAGLTALCAYAISLVPFVFSPAFRMMVFGSQEQGRLIAIRLPVGPQMWLLVAPAAILLLWFRFLAYRHRNWDLLMLYLGILFSVFVLVAPPAPGYVLWSLPFLLHFLCRSRAKDAVALITYGIAYLVFFWVHQGSDFFDAWRTTVPMIANHISPYEYLMLINPSLAQVTESVSFTLLQSSLVGVILFMYLVGVKRNNDHNARGNPVMIGVAGDSGSGKDRFVKSLIEVIGEDRVAVVAGDDYHRWPRGHEMWKDFTHLDAKANFLHKLHQHALLFANGEPVLKSTYDHVTGTSSDDEFRDPSDVIVFQGLHSLSIDALRRMYDLAIFLDPEESLRHEWKIERDGRERGHTRDQVLKSLEARKVDRETFILPQVDDAELVVRWMHSVADGGLRLEVVASNSFDFEGLVAEFQRVSTISVQHDYLPRRKQSLTLDGHMTAPAIADVARCVIKERSEYVQSLRFRGGLEGGLQLIVSVCLIQKLFWKRR